MTVCSKEMTEKQFEAVARLLRMSKPDIKEAARLVLVDGRSRLEATEITGKTGPAISNALRRCRKTHQIIVDAYLDLGERANGNPS